MGDLISRCELFNKLAVLNAPPEANDYKAEVYKIIQGMNTKEVEDECKRVSGSDQDVG